MHTEPLHANSLIRLLRRAFAQAGLPSPDDYSGHSLRRGFAAWADANGWDIKTLMEYVGWKDVKSAMRYLDGADPFARHRLDRKSTRLNSSHYCAPRMPDFAGRKKRQAERDKT